jgi:ketosteroid isomerase-like protein
MQEGTLRMWKIESSRARRAGAGLAAALVACLPGAPTGTVFGQTKEKHKGGIVRRVDKSKPVRRALEQWYEANIDAFNRKDVEAIMRLRSDDFHTITPDGTVNSREAMERRTREFVGRIDRFLSQDISIGDIQVEGDLASAYITQRTKRLQRLQDGELHVVEAGAIQRETWKRTPEGWKLYKVDDIRDAGLLVDGKPVTK